MEFGTAFKVLAETELTLKSRALGRLKEIKLERLKESLLGRNSLEESLPIGPRDLGTTNKLPGAPDKIAQEIVTWHAGP